MPFTPPPADCLKCERLCAFRAENKKKYPSYHNAPVPSFGDINAEILVVGLAPGLNGANQTGRPFTNDYAGDILYPALKENKLAKGQYKKIKDGFELINTRITNAVRCVPPQNKPTTAEEKTCRTFLKEEINAMPRLKVILCLGTVSHKNVLQALGLKQSFLKFAHGAVYNLPNRNIKLIDSYHTSRYNINTGVLSYDMFDNIIKKIKGLL